MRFRSALIWIVLWIAVAMGAFWSGNKATQTLDAYLDVGGPSIAAASELIPAQINFFVYDAHFSQEWKALRGSNFYGALKGLSALREPLESWKITEKEFSPAEKWLTEFFGPEVLLGVSTESKSVYLVSPIGKRDAVIDWLLRMVVADEGKGVKWKLRQIDGRWCLDAEEGLAPAQYKVQLSVINGIAVLAIGREGDPIAPVLQLASKSGQGLATEKAFDAFFKAGLAQGNAPFGFFRPSAGQSLGVQWTLAAQVEGKVTLDLVVPRISAPATTVQPSSSALAGLRQADDYISCVASWDEVRVLWEEALQRLPASWTTSMREINLKSAMGSFDSVWTPVFDKLGRNVFIGLGESEVISEKYRIPVPRAVIAFPLTDTAGFIVALEKTVLEANERLGAKLLIRKGPKGNYYEVRMGKSEWREQHGLKQLPVFAFSNGLLIIAPDTSAMEKALANAKSTEVRIDGIDLQVNMRSAPATVRILLAALGAFNAQGENVFLSPRVLHGLSEMATIMEQFGRSDFVIHNEPGFSRIHATLNP